MKHAKKMLALGLAVAMTSVAMTGCGATSGSEESSSAEAVSSSASGDTVEVRFSWWGNEARHEATLEAIALYEEQNPGVKIVAEYSTYDGYRDKLMAQIAAGNAPDIFTCEPEWYPALYESNAMADLTDSIDWSYFDQASLDACSYNGTIYGVNVSQNAYGVYYNKTLADQYGVQIPEGDYTWDDLVALLEEAYVKSNGQVYGMSDIRSMGWTMQAFGYTKLAKEEPYMWSNEALTVTAEDATAYYEYIENMPEGCLLPPDQSFTTDTFTSAPVAQGITMFDFNSIGSFASVQSQTENELGVLPLPVGDNGESGNVNRPGLILSVYEGSAVKEEAAKFLDWFVNSTDAATILKMSRGVLPTSVQREALAAQPDLLSATDVVINDAVNQILQGELHTFVPGPMGADQILTTVAKTVGQEQAFGQLTPEEAGQKFMQEAEKAITY